MAISLCLKKVLKSCLTLEFQNVSRLKEMKRILEANKQILPYSNHIVFEGGNGEDDIITFEPYHGERHAHHKKNAYSAVLDGSVVQHSQQYEKHEFLLQFLRQMEKIKLNYDKIATESLRIVGRFGKLYFEEPVPTMALSRVVQAKTFFNKGEGNRSSFMPLAISHDTVEKYLEQEGYQLINEEERFLIQIYHFYPSLKEKKKYTVLQDFEFKFLEFWKPVSKRSFDIVKRNSNVVRISIEAEIPTFEVLVEKTMQMYKDAKILNKDAEKRLIVNEDYRENVGFVRQKVTKIYRSSNKFEAEIHLIKAKEYTNQDKQTGRFLDVKDCREELIIVPKIPGIKEINEEYAENLIELCYQFEKIF